MNISSANFILSSTDPRKCPLPDFPEYAFIGRSNVGKSSLINLLTGKKGLAKTSSTPGKTQTINHFLINNEWFLADLPGYGYARTGKATRSTFSIMITSYLRLRPNLMNTFLLVDARHAPQKIDIEFMEWMAEQGLPFTIVFTKCDKLGSTRLGLHIEDYKKQLSESWEELPHTIMTSSESGLGKDEILDMISSINPIFNAK